MTTTLLPPQIEPNSSPVVPEKACATAPSILCTEMKVIASVLCVLLLVEVTFRFAGQKLSKDIAHLRSLDAISAELANLPAEQGTKVLFLGNSLTRYGVDTERFAQVCQQQYGEPIQAIKMNPDNTALADWFYAYRTYFSRVGQLPDVLILGFEGGHLRDAPSSHPDRLAQYYCTPEDYSDLRHYDIHGFENQANYILSSLSAAYGNRDRLQRRALDLLIPDYRAGMDELNRRMNAQQQPTTSTPVEPSYSRLLELIAQAEQDGVQVILAAMPVPEEYQFDRGLLEVVHSTSAILIDCRHVPGLTRPMFFDGLHMDEQAQELYSQCLAEKCGPYLQPLARKATPPAQRLANKH